MCGLGEGLVGRVRGLRVLLDGLQQERVTGDPLDRHHQEERQVGRIDLWSKGAEMHIREGCKGQRAKVRSCKSPSDRVSEMPLATLPAYAVGVGYISQRSQSVGSE